MAEIETWTDYEIVWSGVIRGTGAERWEAAQLFASQPAIFWVLANSETLALSVEERISFAGGLWNITSVVPPGLNEGVEVAAVRTAT